LFSDAGRAPFAAAPMRPEFPSSVLCIAASHQRKSVVTGPIARPVIINAMTGSTVGHYEILEKLGEGGMGVVYKARDVLLNRTAALKFLPSEGAGSGDQRKRFVHEAQSASALNHPNIVTIYEISRAGERDFIAMELVRGQSLDQAIGRKALPLAKALDYGIQIAAALAAAHSAGIIHRDLKPGNVMVSDTGFVKVLDFGLAKLMAGVSNASDATRTILEGPKTADGAIVGTVSYMSPEQAEGKPVDHRSDIFSFGALFYEMLTGRRAFQGESAVSTLAAILTADPAPLTVEAPGMHAELVRIVSRCLRKPPEKRWQNIADVAIAIEEFKHDLESGRLASQPAIVPAPQRRRWIPLVAAALLAAALTGLVSWSLRPSAPAPENWRIHRLTSDTGATLFPAITTDGKLVAYVSDRAASDSMDLWVQQADGGDPVQLTRGLRFCKNPAFSPDGARIVMECEENPDTIYVVPALGGLPRKIAQGEVPQFSPDGSQIAYLAAASSGGGQRSIWTVPADGGTVKEIKVDRGIYSGPVWRPDGKGLLFIGARKDGKTDQDWFFVTADGGSITPTGAVRRLDAAGLGLGQGLNIMPGGLLFSAGNFESTNVYRMPFDPNFLKATGDPVPIIVGAGFNFAPASSQDGRRIAFAIGNNLVANIWRAPVDSATGKVAGEPVRVIGGVERSQAPSPSADGKRLAYLGGTTKSPEIRIRDLATGKDLRLAEAREWSYLVLSPDSSTVAFGSDQPNHNTVYTVPADGGIPKAICAACGRPVEWSHDRAKLLLDNAGPQSHEIHILDVATRKASVLLQHPQYPLYMPRISPDGKLLAFSAMLPGRARRVYLAPFTGNPVAEKDWTLLIDGADFDRQPLWAPSGNLIYFLSDRDGSRCIWAQRVDPASRQASGAPFAVHHVHQIRSNLEMIVDPARVGLSVAGGQMFYASFELHSNVWLAERPLPAGK
jgi:serine/threonine protein kinase/Tol biopolymer transport system component